MEDAGPSDGSLTQGGNALPVPGKPARETLVRQLDNLIRQGRPAELLAIVELLPNEARTRPIRLRQVIALLLLARLPEAEALRERLLSGATTDEAQRLVIEFWRIARRCAGADQVAEAAFAAGCAATLLHGHDVLPSMSDRHLLDGLLADAVSGKGEFAVSILGMLLDRGVDRSFFIKFVGSLGGSRPHLDGKRPLDVMADRARAVAAEPDAPSARKEGAALILYAAQDFQNALKVATGAPPGGIAAMVAEDAQKRVAVSQQMRKRATASARRSSAATRLNPPFIVVHRGGQDYFALCAASLAMQNGASNVVLLGDASTATIGIGRYAAISDYFDAAAAFAPSYVHHSVSEPVYGLFSFQRWLVVEEYCRKNRIDQCVVIDSDALAFSSASEIIAAMPEGYGMNDWTWTTTVRDRLALSGLADCMRSVYARPREEVVPFVNRLGRYIAGRPDRSFQDMHMFYHYRDSTRGVVLSQYSVPFHGGLDQASTLSNGLETGSPGELAPIVLGKSLKRPYLENGRLHFREEGGEGRLIRYHTVHCQGPAKAVLHHYAQLMLSEGKASLATWEGAPVAAPKDATPPPAEAVSTPAPARLPDSSLIRMPNLRHAEHAALKEKLRQHVARLGPLNVDIKVRLPEGATVEAGDDLPVELHVHNPGQRGFEDGFEGFAALTAGFLIALDTPAGPEKVAEPRLPVPAGGFPAGTTTVITGSLPTAKLQPGRYVVSAGLVFEYIRWFERDVAKRPTVAFNVVTGD